MDDNKSFFIYFDFLNLYGTIVQLYHKKYKYEYTNIWIQIYIMKK